MTVTSARPTESTAAPASYFTGWDHLEFWVGNARQAAQFRADLVIREQSHARSLGHVPLITAATRGVT